jgi:membrane associated rhomboid family serine protease
VGLEDTPPVFAPRQLFSYQFAHAEGQHILGNMIK